MRLFNNTKRSQITIFVIVAIVIVVAIILVFMLYRGPIGPGPVTKEEPKKVEKVED